jgi:hypothetical protein
VISQDLVLKLLLRQSLHDHEASLCDSGSATFNYDLGTTKATLAYMLGGGEGGGFACCSSNSLIASSQWGQKIHANITDKLPQLHTHG